VTSSTAWLDPFNVAAHSFLNQVSGPFLQQTGDPVAAQQLALQALAKRQQQASALAYFDVFWVLAVVTSRLRLLCGRGKGSSIVTRRLYLLNRVRETRQ
jgi:hypothetical protein